MRTLDLYVLRRVLWPLLALLSIAVVALLLERLVGLLDLFVSKGGPLSLVVQMLTNLVPHYVGIALPATFFVAVLVTIMRLNQTSEIGAMQAAGISSWRLIAPIMALALVLTVFSAITINYLQPYARYAYRSMAFALTHTAWNAAVESGAFFTGLGDTTVLVEGANGERVAGIFAYREEPSGGSTVITAERGSLHSSGAELRLLLRLENGLRAEIERDESVSRVIRFDRFDLPLDLAFDGNPFRTRGRDEEEMTLAELWSARSPSRDDAMAVLIDAEISHRLVRTLTVLVLPLLAVPLGIAGGRERRGIAIAVGLILLILYHHTLQVGYSFARSGRIPPVIGLWLPFAVLALGSLWFFVAASRRPEGNPLSDVLARVDAVMDFARGQRGWQRGTG